MAGYPAIAWSGLRAEEAGGGVPGLRQAHGKCRSGSFLQIALFLGNGLLLLLLQGLWPSHQANKVEGAGSSDRPQVSSSMKPPPFSCSLPTPTAPEHSRESSVTSVTRENMGNSL